MSTFTFWKGAADAAVGVILLAKPEIIYHSFAAKALSRLSGLRLPNPYPTAAGEVSAQHAVAIMVIVVGIGHMRASRERRAITAFALMNAVWASLAFGTVVFKPHRATSALLMTGINHLVFSSVIIWQSKMGVRELFGLGDQRWDKSKAS
ncbi:hypothetical protein IQ07DRAFT_641807 [Pyrenochaeta sp. DS3sAY3a]|nr:hypothetical protein IQ07DRAFT_641807 [Pyrenochaeta sp. DS3sAY3a]